MFGALAQDTGSHLDPGDRGSLSLDPNFDMSSKEAQSWMFKFCNSLKKQPWYKYTHGDLQLSNCFIITFKEFMYRPCYNDLSKENHRPCCRESAFPFEPAVFNECLLAAVDELYETPSFLWLPGKEQNILLGNNSRHSICCFGILDSQGVSSQVDSGMGYCKL